ncbi:MAG TPA: DinB family protein [Thermoanaerobaculia bacterium]|nr:DinB family protein [Thermoanaerobaculia bacterium]
MEIQRVEPFLDYFEKVRERTRRVVLCVPPERLEWTHKPGAFTFGDLIRHLAAIERYMFAENAQCRPSRYPGHGKELADGWSAVLAYFDERHRESVEIFTRLTPEDLTRRCETPGGAKIAVWKWLRSMIEHEIHHRGQIYLMLGILWIPTPPLYGLTSEEVYARSMGET